MSTSTPQNDPNQAQPPGSPQLAPPGQTARSAPDHLVSDRGILLIAIGFLVLAIGTFYLLIVSWPVTDGADGKLIASHFLGIDLPTTSERRLFVTVISAGALGSLIHTLTSLADYIGNRKLGKSWIWWFILRIPIGISLALVFYLLLRGGLMVPTLPGGNATANANATTNATDFLNPYGIAAISAMAGMFSKQATDKLRELFDTLFRTQQPVSRADPLPPAAPVIASTEPTKLTLNSPVTLEIHGERFQPNCKVTVNGVARDADRINDTVVKVILKAADVSALGSLQLVVENPDGGRSEAFTVAVE